jgi:RNA methyltransferase, TrmH family
MNKNTDKIISSQDNKKFKELKALSESTGISKYREILISGKKIINEILTEKKLNPLELIIFENYIENDPSFNEHIKYFEKNNKLVIMKKSLFNEIDLINTQHPLLVAETPEFPLWDYHKTSGCTLILPFQNPVNIGSCIRSAAALGVKKIIILKDAANPFHHKSIRSSAGAVFNTKIYRGPEFEELLLNHKKLVNLITLDMNGADLNSFSFPDNFLLLPGIEGQGLTKKFKHQSISIKMEKGVESLNASVSVSITLFEWKRRLASKNS